MSASFQSAKPRLKKRFAIFGGLIVAPFLGLAISQIRLEKEPVYGGKPLSFWLNEFNGRSAAPGVFNPSRHQQALEAIRQIGTNGLPVYLRLMRTTDDQWKMRLRELASKKLVKIRHRSASQLHRDATIGFVFLGVRGTNAIPDLIRIIEGGGSPSSRSCAEAALRRMGQAAVPQLIRYFRHRSDRVRLAAVSAVMDAGGPAESLVPVLRSLLKDRGVQVHTNTVMALGKFGAEARSAMPELLRVERLAIEKSDHVLKQAVQDARWKIAPDSVAEAVVVEDKTPMIVNGAATENLYMEAGAERTALIWAGSGAPSRPEHWSGTAGGRFELYRGGNYGPDKGASVGEFKISGISTNSEINARIFCTIADGKIFISARNFSNEVLKVRRVE